MDSMQKWAQTNAYTYIVHINSYFRRKTNVNHWNTQSIKYAYWFLDLNCITESSEIVSLNMNTNNNKCECCLSNRGECAHFQSCYFCCWRCHFQGQNKNMCAKKPAKNETKISMSLLFVKFNNSVNGPIWF